MHKNKDFGIISLCSFVWEIISDNFSSGRGVLSVQQPGEGGLVMSTGAAGSWTQQRGQREEAVTTGWSRQGAGCGSADIPQG